MPTIPLLKPNIDVAMPKVPALDRVPRPQIDGRGVLDAMGDLGRASQMPLINPEPFVEAAGAGGLAMGKGLIKAGDVLNALAQKRLESHEELQVQRFHADMRRENERRANYQNSNRDASQWMTDAQRGAQKVTKPYENVAGVGPAVQQQLKGMANSYASFVTANTGADVDKARFGETAAAMAENFDASMEFGDYDGADKLAERGRDLHYFSEAQMQGMLAQTVKRRREDQLMTVVQEHPQEAPGWFAQEDKLSEYQLTPWERQEWEHRAQSFWEDHERQSVGQVLDGVHNGDITEVKQLEHWKQDMGPKAYADLTEMLTARRPAGLKNDPAVKEQTMATIATAHVQPEEVDSQIAMARLGESIKSLFTGRNRDELLGRLKATVDGLDTAKNKILGPALQQLNEWVFGHPVSDVVPKAVDAGPEAAPLLPSQATLPASVVERVRSIRENLEEAIKTGKLKTAEDATDHVAKELSVSGWPVRSKDLVPVPAPDAGQSPTMNPPEDSPSPLKHESTDRKSAGKEDEQSPGRPLFDLGDPKKSLFGESRYVQAPGETKRIEIQNQYNADTPYEAKLELRSVILGLKPPAGETLPRPIVHIQHWLDTDNRPTPPAGREEPAVEIPYAELHSYSSTNIAESRLFQRFRDSPDNKVLGGMTPMAWAKTQPNLKAGGPPIKIPDIEWDAVVSPGIGAYPYSGQEELYYSLGKFMIYGKGSDFTATKGRDGSVTIVGTVNLSVKDTYNWNTEKDFAAIPVPASYLNKYKPPGMQLSTPMFPVVNVSDGFFKDLLKNGKGRDFNVVSKEDPTVKIRFDDRLNNVNIDFIFPKKKK